MEGFSDASLGPKNQHSVTQNGADILEENLGEHIASTKDIINPIVTFILSSPAIHYLHILLAYGFSAFREQGQYLVDKNKLTSPERGCQGQWWRGYMETTPALLVCPKDWLWDLKGTGFHAG